MIIAILSAVVCLIIAIVLFTPMFRTLVLFRPVALFFVFEGIWIMCDYIISQIWPNSEAMQWVHYSGIIIFGGYLLLCLILSRPRKHKKKKSSKNNKHVNPDNRL